MAINRRAFVTALMGTTFLGGCVSQSDYNALEAQNRALQEQVGRLQGAIRYTVNSDLLFPSGSWRMSTDGKDIISKLASQLAATQQTKLVVNGYTDNAPVGATLRRQGVTSNQILSQRRAEDVMQFMISKGVRPDMISAQGHGEANPVASNDTAEGRARNRRVEITLVDPGPVDPVGQIHFRGGSVAAGIGFSWGSGTLIYKGKTYDFGIEGFSVVDVGVSRIDASGGVYHLSNISDFEGTYAAVDVGVTLAGGGSLLTMRNRNGVVIQIRSNTAGLRINAAPSGITIRMR